MAKLFFSYSHRDADLRDELETHLAPLKREGVLEIWHDRRIGAGKEFANEISRHLEETNIILLLVSPYFIASDYCYDIEMKRAMERHENGESRVIPVILEPCDWQKLPFGKLIATPTDGKPISKFPNKHDGFLEVTRAIRNAAEDLCGPVDGKPAEIVAKAENRRTPKAARPRSSNLRLKKNLRIVTEIVFLQRLSSMSRTSLKDRWRNFKNVMLGSRQPSDVSMRITLRRRSIAMERN